MNFFKHYGAICGLIGVAGLVLMAVLNISVIGAALRMLGQAIYPLLIGCFIAFVLNLILKRIEPHYFPKRNEKWVQKTKRPACIVISLIIVSVTVVIVSWLAIPQMIHSLGIVVQSLPELYKNGVELWTYWSSQFSFLPVDSVKQAVPFDSVVSNLGKAGSQSATYLVSIMGNAVGAVFDFTIGLIFAIYILANKEEIQEQVSRLCKVYLPMKWDYRLHHWGKVAVDTFGSFLVGQFLDALILGAMVALGLFVCGVPYAATIGCVIGLTALIPLLGAYLGGAIGLIMLLTVSLMDATLFVIVLVIMQQLEGNFIYPKIVGNSVGLPGIWVFAAITIGGSLYGVLGIFLSVPLAATLYKLIGENMDSHLQEGNA